MQSDQTFILKLTLQLAVPLQIDALKSLTDDQRQRAAEEAAEIIATHGDDLQFGGRHCAEAFNALARGLALGAAAPGGITFAGLHWCTTPHPECPHATPATSKACLSPGRAWATGRA